jgi:hypothetical protein
MSIASIFFKIQIDFGITAFEIRDHITTERWDAREQSIRDYIEELQIFLSGLRKRSLEDGYDDHISHTYIEDSYEEDFLQSTSLSPGFPVFTWDPNTTEVSLQRRSSEVRIRSSAP